MSDDYQSIYDGIFAKIMERLPVEDSSRNLVRALDSTPTSTPTGSTCPLPEGYRQGDTKAIYAVEGQHQLGLADEDGNLLDIHCSLDEDDEPEFHVRMNDVEMHIPVAFWNAASRMMEDYIDDEDE